MNYRYGYSRNYGWMWGALGVAGVALMGWGLWPAQKTTLRLEYGAWEAQAFLREHYESCNWETVGTGKDATSVWRCHTNTRTLDQVWRQGICNPQICEPIRLPDPPAQWAERQARDSDLFVEFRTRQTLFFRDLEAPGDGGQRVIPMDYSPEAYSDRLPQIGGNLQARRNNFGVYYRP